MTSLFGKEPKMFYKFLANDFSVFSYKTLGETFEKMKLFPTALEAYSKGFTQNYQICDHTLIIQKKLSKINNAVVY